MYVEVEIPAEFWSWVDAVSGELVSGAIPRQQGEEQGICGVSRLRAVRSGRIHWINRRFAAGTAYLRAGNFSSGTGNSRRGTGKSNPSSRQT